MLLEANARAGLAIQIANHQGLLHRLAAIDRGETVLPQPPRTLPEEAAIAGRIGPRRVPLRSSA
jgi:hypothetical protein